MSAPAETAQLDRVLARLRAHEAELKARSILHAAVFGSVARGEARPDSDVDIMVELDPEARIDLFGSVALGTRLTEIVGHPVDMARRGRLKTLIRPHAEREAVDAF